MTGRRPLAILRRRAADLKANLVGVWFAARDPRTPTAAKVLASIVIAYALSPIDLIPDFIPVLGYLDDVILLPLGILLCIRMIPPELWQEFRRRGEGLRPADLRPVRGMAVLIVLVWVAVAAGILVLILR